MLSTSVIKNASDAGHYYSSKDNYYTKEEGIEQSEWYGKGAQKLNLVGEVNSAQFTDLLQGHLPSGELLGKRVDGTIVHRAGWDLTFSAPKSLSIIALVSGDKRLIDAHRNAVKTALSEIERGCSEARIKIGSEVSYQNTKNIIAALYHHDLSRELDPQLHTHCVIMNMTERSDGRFRSQASKMGRYDKEASNEIHGFIERVRHNKRYFGKLYEAELAFQVKELGYDIAINSKTGVFEIVDVPQVVNEHFSKRRSQIEKNLAENGLSGGKAADYASINTRQNKRSVDRGELKEQWQNDASQLGLNSQSIIEKSNQSQLPAEPTIKVDKNAISILKTASKEISEFKTTFLMEEVVSLAAHYAILEKVDVVSLLNATDDLIKSGEFITIHHESGKTHLMDKNTIQVEKQIDKHIKENQFLESKISKTTLNHYLDEHSKLSNEMKHSLREIFSEQRYVLIEGERGREELSKPIIELIKAHKLNVEIVSPTQINSKKFAASLKDNPTTLWQHIKSWFIDNKIENKTVTQLLKEDKAMKPDLLLVDKSHLLSTQQTADLLAWGKENNKPLIFFANKNVLLSQKQSIGTDYLIKQGIKTVKLTEKENTIQSDIVNQDFHSIVNKLSKQMQEVKHEEDRMHAMSKAFCRLENHDSTFLIVNKKQNVSQLNTLIHTELKEAGKLKNAVMLQILIPQFVSENAAKLAGSYSKNAWVRFNESSKSLSIQRGEYLQVISHNKKTNEVLLKSADDKTIAWHPDKFTKIEMFKEKSQEFCVDERIQFHRSAFKLGFAKGEHAVIRSINQNRMKLEKEDGRSVTLDLSKQHLRHFDYGYVNTAHGLIHEKPHHIIAELPSNSFHTDKRKFFQIVSQAKEVSIYTDDIQTLCATLDRKSGDRLSVDKILQQSKELKASLTSLYDVLEKSIASQKKTASPVNISKQAFDAIDYAVKHLSEREAAFTHKELMFTAMQYAIGEVNAKELTQVTRMMANANQIVPASRTDGTLWTTLDAINMERQIVALSLKDKGQFQAIATDTTIHQLCDPQKLHPEKIDAVKKITQSTDRVLTIQGRAGTGKTTLMTTLSDVVATKGIFEKEGYELVGLAPTHTAIHELTSRGIPAQTLDSFLIEMKKFEGNGSPKPDFSRKVFILDEASMVSNRKMLDVLKIMHDLNARLFIPTGDTRQIASLESGKPHELIQKTIDPIKLEYIRRQESDTLKKAVKETYEYDFKAAFQTLEKSIIEIGSVKNPNNKETWRGEADLGRLDRIKALVSDYASFPRESRS
ncbi:MAG: MobF family relaxase, partial [Gammaproteobacteria bacterium]